MEALIVLSNIFWWLFLLSLHKKTTGMGFWRGTITDITRWREKNASRS